MTAAGQQSFFRLFRRADWMEHGACRGMDPNHWHPRRGTTPESLKAKAICADCPVAERCLSWAIETGERQGIWGGVSIDTYRRGRLSGQRPPTAPKGAPIQHGTLAGHQMHRRRGIPVCDECREARNERRRQLRAGGRAA